MADQPEQQPEAWQLILGLAFVAVLVLWLVSSCGGSEAEPKTSSSASRHEAAAQTFAELFGTDEKVRCRDYGTVTLDFEERPVSYCYSGRMFAGRPFNTGCYLIDG